MNIREYNQNDIGQIKNLLVQLQDYIIKMDKYNLNILSPKYREEYFEYMLNDCISNEGKIFVAEYENKIAGFVAGFVQNYDERDKLDYACPKKGIVSELVVDQNFRNDGIGGLLLDKIENYFKNIKCEFIQIDVFAYTQVAEHFYKKKGYENRMLTMFKKVIHKDLY